MKIKIIIAVIVIGCTLILSACLRPYYNVEGINNFPPSAHNIPQDDKTLVFISLSGGGTECENVDIAGDDDLAVYHSADIDIVLDSHSNVLRVPTEAVLEDDEVYRYNANDGTLEKVSLEVGLRN